MGLEVLLFQDFIYSGVNRFLGEFSWVFFQFLDVFNGFSQGGACCVDVQSLGINEGSLGGEGSFKLIDFTSKIFFCSLVGDLHFFQLAGL